MARKRDPDRPGPKRGVVGEWDRFHREAVCSWLASNQREVGPASQLFRGGVFQIVVCKTEGFLYTHSSSSTRR